MSETEPIPPTSSVTALRIPIIKKGEYDLWSMKMRQYIAITDHILWDIITNGDQATTDPASSSVPKTSLAANARRNNEKALNILLSAIPDRHLLSFHDATNAKTLWTAIKARFGGNEASKKMQKNLLKQQFETFTIGSREELDSAYRKEVKGSTLKQSTAEPAHIPKGYTQATSSKVPTAPNYDMKKLDITMASGYDNSKDKEVMRKDRRPMDLKPKNVLDWTKEFDAEPVTYAMMALTEVEQDDWSMEFDAEHMHFGQDGLDDFDWSNKADDAQDETLTDSVYENLKRKKAYKAVPPPTGTIIPPRANVSFTGIDELAIRNKIVNQEKTKSSQSAIDRNKVIIEDWVDSDDEETDVSESQKETAFNSENSETSFENRSPNSQNSVGQESRTKGLGNKGGKLCFVCYSPNHLIKDCNLHERTFNQTQTHKPKGTQGLRDTIPVWNNANRVNHSNFSRNSRYPHQRRSFIPSAVLTREGLKSTAKPKLTRTVPSKSTAHVSYQSTARPKVPHAVLSQSTGRPYHPRMDNIRPRTSSFSPSSRSSSTRTPHRPQRPKKIVKSIWVKKGSTVGSQAVLPQTISVKKSAMITYKYKQGDIKGNYLDYVNKELMDLPHSSNLSKIYGKSDRRLSVGITPRIKKEGPDWDVLILILAHSLNYLPVRNRKLCNSEDKSLQLWMMLKICRWPAAYEFDASRISSLSSYDDQRMLLMRKRGEYLFERKRTCQQEEGVTDKSTPWILPLRSPLTPPLEFIQIHPPKSDNWQKIITRSANMLVCLFLSQEEPKKVSQA
ncbi:hypothetical protein Tco_0907503 [Tanacetum coccineum]|uniref:Uncharacterized protein n=1 Tax=Tanacetum coccineum TaxID=301880 RepID=A0ABQ5CLN1_9ASTR